MAKATTPWFVSLNESVYALGSAAREYRAARQTAQITAWNVDPARVLPVDGAVNVSGDASFVSPHDDALWRLSEAYGRWEVRVRHLYENTALAYAHGTAAAMQSVLRGECPRYVVLGRSDGLYLLPAGMLPDLREALSRWTGAQELAGLREKVAGHERAYDAMEDLSAIEQLADHEAAELCDAATYAAGTAAAAYAYGECAERALHFLLLAAKAAPRTTNSQEDSDGRN